MDNTDSEEEGGNTPPITAEFIEQTFSQFSRTLKELTDWKQQVIKIFSKNFKIEYCNYTVLYVVVP